MSQSKLYLSLIRQKLVANTRNQTKQAILSKEEKLGLGQIFHLVHYVHPVMNWLRFWPQAKMLIKVRGILGKEEFVKKVEKFVISKEARKAILNYQVPVMK